MGIIIGILIAMLVVPYGRLILAIVGSTAITGASALLRGGWIFAIIALILKFSN